MKEIGDAVNPPNATIPAFFAWFPALAALHSPLVRVRGLLRENRQLAAALPEAESLRELNQRFAGVVPREVARACRVAALRGDTAMLFCANGAAASRVRAQAKGIARALTRDDAPVRSVSVKVRADWAPPPPPPRRELPASALRAFEALDHELPEGDLRTAVERLLARRRER